MKSLENKKTTQNGVKRLVFCIIAILLQLGFFILLFTTLNAYAPVIDVATKVAALLLVLILYGQYHTTSAIKTPWIILILTLPVLGIVLFCLIGLNGSTRAMRRRYREVDDRLLPLLPENAGELKALKEINPKAGAISSYLAVHSKYPVYQNTKVEYFDEAIKGLNAQLQDLKGAQKFIFMEYHAIEDDKAWKMIEEILVDRVRAGVLVRVFYDDIGSIGFVNKSFARKLEDLGIECRVFNPFVPGLNGFLNNRDHRKITVIDGIIGYTGGYNLANEYFGFTHPYGKWKDTGIRLYGEAVRSLSVAFLEMWNASRKGDLDDEHRIHEFLNSSLVSNQMAPETFTEKINISSELNERGFVQPYADIPLDNEQVGEEVYISMADKAERYCYFMTPYLIITDEMTHALSLAAKRGVDVRIITPGIPDKKLIYSITRSFYGELVRNGVRIYEWTPGFCHAKMSVADDEMATCGTINLDYRSLYHHFENGCFLAGCGTVLAIRDDFKATMQQCKEVTSYYETPRSRLLGIKQLLLRLFAQLL